MLNAIFFFSELDVFHQHHPETSTNVPLLPLEADIASDGSNKSAKCHNEPLAAQAFGGDSNSAGQLRRDLCDMLALVARAIKLVGAGLARAVDVGQRSGAIGRPAGDLIHVGQPRKGVGEAHDDHALVKQCAMERGDGRFLAAMLGARAGEHAADLAD